jgi:hypothetical protein
MGCRAKPFMGKIITGWRFFNKLFIGIEKRTSEKNPNSSRLGFAVTIPFANDIRYVIKAGWKPAIRIAGFQPAQSLQADKLFFTLPFLALK